MSLIQNIPKVLSGKLSNYTKSLLASGDIGGLITAAASKLRSYCGSLKTKYDNLICSFASNSDIIADRWLEDARIITDEWDSYVVEISSETKDDMLSAMTEVGLTADSVVHLTNAQGDDAMVVLSDAVDGTKHCILSSCKNPENYTDFILYEEDGKFFLSNLITSNNYELTSGLGDVRTINDAVAILCEFYGSRAYDGTIYDGLHVLLAAVNLVYYPNDTIESMAERFVLHYQSDFLGLTDLIELSLDKVPPPKTRSLLDFLRDIANANGITDLCYNLCSSIVIGDKSVADLMPIITDSINSGIATTMSFARGCKNALLQGGPYGLLIYMTTCWKDANTLKVEDGVLTFANNASIAPTAFGAGVLATVGEALMQVVSMAAFAISPIVGAIVSVLQIIVSAVVKGVKYAQSLEYCSVQHEDGNCDYLAPYGILQFTKEYNVQNGDVIPADMYAYLENQCQAFEVDVPGGSLFIGRGGTTVDDIGDVATWSVRCEFHPSYSGIGRRFFQKLGEGKCLAKVAWSQARNVYQTTFRMSGLGTYPTDVILDMIDEVYADDETVDIIPDNTSEGHLSSKDDNYVKRSIAFNYAMFFLWCHAKGLMNMISSKPWEFILEGATYGSSTADYHDEFWFGSQNVFATPPAMVAWAILNYCEIEHETYRSSGVWEITPIPWKYGHERVSDYETWSNLASFAQGFDGMSAWSKYGGGSYDPIDAIFLAGSYQGVVTDLPANYGYSLVVPKYDRGSVIKFIVLASITTAVIAAATVAITIVAKKRIQRKRAQLTADVYNKSEAFADNPSDPAAYNAYRKAVRKNNFFTSIFGGNKYNYTNYWDGDQSDTGETMSSGDFDLSTIAADSNQLEPTALDADKSATENALSIESIYNLIRGA